MFRSLWVSACTVCGCDVGALGWIGGSCSCDACCFRSAARLAAFVFVTHKLSPIPRPAKNLPRAMHTNHLCCTHWQQREHIFTYSGSHGSPTPPRTDVNQESSYHTCAKSKRRLLGTALHLQIRHWAQQRGSITGGTTLRRLMSRSGQAPHATYNASFMQHLIAGRPDRIADHSGRAQALSMPAICVHCTPPQVPNVQGLNVQHMHNDSGPMCLVPREQAAATSHHIRQGNIQGRHRATPPSHSPCLGCVAQVEAVPHLRACVHTYMQGPETKRVVLLEGLHTESSCCMCAGAFRTWTLMHLWKYASFDFEASYCQMRNLKHH